MPGNNFEQNAPVYNNNNNACVDLNCGSSAYAQSNALRKK